LHWGVTRARAALALAAVVAVGLVLLSGGSEAGPRTPAGPAGMPPPFLGTALVGSGGVSAAIDSYGDVVDLREGAAGPALIDNPAARQAAGTVAADTGIVPRVRIGGGEALALWRADSVSQRYLRGTNVVRTVAHFGSVVVVVTAAAEARLLALEIWASGGGVPSVSVDVEEGVRCARGERTGQLDLLCRVGRSVPSVPAGAASVLREVSRLIRSAAGEDRAWLARARRLGPGAPGWARGLYRRSLLVLRALTERRSGAVAAGARDGWAYVWPRDAATAGLAFEAAGYDAEARRVVGFLTDLHLDAAARFDGAGAPVPGREPQGDARGWVEVAAAAVGQNPGLERSGAEAHRPDYQEGDPGTYLGNAISIAGSYPTEGVPSRPELAAAIRRRFATPDGLVRESGDPASGLDSAAAWAVRPFSMPALYPLVRRTLVRLLATGGRYGIVPGGGWAGGEDPWSAPTAWTACAFATLARVERGERAAADRRVALRLLADLRRAATPAGALPERVDAETGVPRSTTPLAWSHAFAILTLPELWPE
jgi:hypothetical protein